MEDNKQLLESAKKRFQMIMEYTTFNDNVDEADANADGVDDSLEGAGAPPADPSMGAGAPPMDPSMGAGAPPMDPSMGAPGGDPNAAGGPTPPGFAPQIDPSQDPNAAGADGQMPDMGGAPDPNAEQPGPGDQTVEISDLVDNQSEEREKLDGLSDKFSELIGAVKSFEAMIKRNDDKLEDLKTEFEKRNPTQIEKLNLRQVNSYPFSVSPEDYWNDKEKTSNYSVDSDENGKDQGQYVITKNDVDGAVDWKGISNSLDDDDFIYNQTLKGAMGI